MLKHKTPNCFVALSNKVIFLTEVILIQHVVNFKNHLSLHVMTFLSVRSSLFLTFFKMKALLLMETAQRLLTSPLALSGD